MSETSDALSSLTGDERAAVEAARTAARSRFAHYAIDGSMDGAVGPVDPENPPVTEEQFAHLHPASDVVPGLVAARLRRGGRPRSPSSKVAVAMNLDADLLDALQASGEGWQGRANDALRTAMGLDDQKSAPLHGPIEAVQRP